MFLPAECDAKIRFTWFYDENEETLKTADELFGMYEMSVGHGSNFLLNIGPDTRGLLPEADSLRFLELGEKIKASYSSPLPYGKIERNGDKYTVAFDGGDDCNWNLPTKDKLSNTLVICEDISDGQKIESFTVNAYLPHDRREYVQVYEGKTVGHKIICKFGAIRASKYELIVRASDSQHKIKSIEAFYVK